MIKDIGRTPLAAMSATLLPIKFCQYEPAELDWLTPFVYEPMEPTNPLVRIPTPGSYVWTAHAYNVNTGETNGLTWAVEADSAEELYIFARDNVTPLLLANIDLWLSIP